MPKHSFSIIGRVVPFLVSGLGIFGGISLLTGYSCANDTIHFSLVRGMASLGALPVDTLRGMADNANQTGAELEAKGPQETSAAHYSAVSWTDRSGSLWLQGGCQTESSPNEACVKNTWRNDPVNDRWIETEDPSEAGQPGIYASFGEPLTAETPGGRTQAVAWIDFGGVLWLFGGTGYTETPGAAELNDLWKFSPSTGTWTWANALSKPRATGPAEYAVCWKNEWGTLWMFGGTAPKCADYQRCLFDQWRDRTTDTPSPPPVITLLGEPAVMVACGTPYVDAGATAIDGNCLHDLSARVAAFNPVNPLEPGRYAVRYNVTDNEGNRADEVMRIVTVADREAPVITLLGDSEVRVECGGTYAEPGAFCTDSCSGTLPVELGGDKVNNAVPGLYRVTYNALDDSCNRAVEVTRSVTVFDAAPVITSRPPDALALADDKGNAQVPDFLPVLQAWDKCSGPLTTAQSPPAGTTVPMGRHDITLTATDRAGRSTSCSAAFTVRKAQDPATYDARGAALDFTANSGSLEIDTSAMTMTLDGTVVATGADVDGVCVFRFKDVKVASAVAVNVSGSRPLSVTASGDMVWLADLEVPPGTLGGGAGGAGGMGAQGASTAGNAPALPAGEGLVGSKGYGGYGMAGPGGNAGADGQPALHGRPGKHAGPGVQGGAALFNAPAIESTLAAGNGGGGGGGGGAGASTTGCTGGVGGSGAKGADGGGAFILAAQGLLQVTGGRFSANAAEIADGASGAAETGAKGCGEAKGGDGGRGGYGTPGMIKLMGSVVLAEGRNVQILHVLDNSPFHNGAFTRYSNMNSEALAAHAPSFDNPDGKTTPVLAENVYGELITANNPLLLSPTPKIPQLLGGPSTAGCCLNSGYWNQAVVDALIPRNGTLQYTVLRQPSAGGASVFRGFDQVFVKNSGEATLDRVVVSVVGGGPMLLPQSSTGVDGQLTAGSVWTTTVPAGAFVVVRRSPGISPGAVTVRTGAAAQFTVTTASTNIALTYQWRHNGADLRNDMKFSGVDTATLSIKDCLSADEGLYTCAVGEAGTVSLEIGDPSLGGILKVSETSP